MTETSIHTAAARAVPAALLRRLARLAAALAAAERAAAEQSMLRDMPDHLLRDIGLERGRF